MAYLTIREAAEKLGTDEATIREWINRGWLKDVQRRISGAPSGPYLGLLVYEEHVQEKELFDFAEEMGWARLTRKALLKRLNARK